MFAHRCTNLSRIKIYKKKNHSPDILKSCKLIEGFTEHKIFWTPVLVLSSSGRWCGGSLSARCPEQLVSCGPGGCLPFWSLVQRAGRPPPPPSFTLECAELPPLPLFPACSIDGGIVAWLPSQRRPGFRRSKLLAPGSCTETTNFPLFNLQVRGDQCQTLQLNPFGWWLVLGWLLVPTATGTKKVEMTLLIFLK